MSTLEKLIKNVSYNALNNGITLVTGFILSIVIARLLGPEQMGIYSYCTWLLGFTAVFCLLGIPNTNTRYISELNATGQADHVRRLFYVLLLFEVGVFLVVSGVVVVAAYFFYGPDIRVYIILVAANLLPLTLFAMYASTFKGLLRFDAIAITSLIVTPVYVLAVIIGLYLGMGVGGLLVLPLILAPAQLIVFHLFLRRAMPQPKAPADGGLDRTLKKRIFTFWYKLLAISLIDVFVFEKFEVFFLNIYADFSAVAFYTIAFAISAKVMKLIPYSLTNIMLPIFTEKHSIGDTEGKHTVYTYSLKYLFIIIAPIFAGGVFISTELITNLYGIEFKPAADIFWITLLSSSMAAFFGSSASLLSAMEELSVLLTIGIVSICLNIGMDLLLIPRYGIHGAAWANLHRAGLRRDSDLHIYHRNHQAEDPLGRPVEDRSSRRSSAALLPRPSLRSTAASASWCWQSRRRPLSTRLPLRCPGRWVPAILRYSPPPRNCCPPGCGLRIGSVP